MSTAFAVRAPAKVNLGLFVGPPRADGRHELVTVMQPITLADRLFGRRSGRPADRVVVRGASVVGEELAGRAVGALRAALGEPLPAVEIVVEKEIPIAAGLAGGSADAGAALRLCLLLWERGERARALAVAAQLGADVPAQLCPRRYLASGAGERLQELPQPDGSCAVVVAAAPFGLSTAAVYREADRLGLPRSAAELEALAARLAQALGGGAPLPPGELLANDLEAAALSLQPELGKLRRLVGQAGCDHVLLSGSGPTVLGFFAGEGAGGRAREAASWLAATGRFAAVRVAEFARPEFSAAQPLAQWPCHNGGQVDEQA